MKIMIFLMFTLTPLYIHAEEKVIYQYKEYERIDLGDFSIQGDIITPGDLSVKDRKNQFLNSDLYERENFHDFTYNFNRNYQE